MNLNEISNPKQTVLVSCRKETTNGQKDNIITIDWHMPVSIEPKVYAISVGKNRYSLDLIRESQCFVVNFMTIEQEKDIMFCGRHSGLHTDKFRECNFTKEESSTIDCPKIQESSASLECEVMHEFDAGDHIVFFGQVNNTDEKDFGQRIIHVSGEIFKTV